MKPAARRSRRPPRGGQGSRGRRGGSSFHRRPVLPPPPSLSRPTEEQRGEWIRGGASIRRRRVDPSARLVRSAGRSSPRTRRAELSPRAPPSARLAASSSPPCASGLDPAYSAPLASLSAVAAASRALREPALLARGNHLPAHVLWKPQREPLEVAVEAHREGVARGVRPRDERRRPPRPRPHRAALAPDPLQLHRLLPPRLLVLGALVSHVDGHLIRGLLLRGHLAGAARPRPRRAPGRG